MAISYALVTGATGFIGAHVVDNLLDRGFRVRAVARSKTKAKLMQESREKHAAQLDFFFIDDLTTPGVFDEALKGVDGVIHVASPLNYSVVDKEKELIIPAINGVRSLFQAAVAAGGIRRIVMISSFGGVLDMKRTGPWTYSAKDWNPITYAEAADVAATPQDAYRGSKKLAEQEAWKFMEEEKLSFDLVTLCPSMVFGPIAHPVSSVKELNESNKNLWNVASGVVPLPPAAFNFWVDVRDLANVHVLALLKAEAGGKRYLPIAPEKFNYQIVSEIIREEFPEARDRVTTGSQEFIKAADVDARSVVSDLDVTYRSFRETIVSFVRQAYLLDK